MRGISITTRSNKRTINMCAQCYKKENEEVELALEFNLITKPVVTKIQKCQMCEDENDAPSREQRTR